MADLGGQGPLISWIWGVLAERSEHGEAMWLQPRGDAAPTAVHLHLKPAPEERNADFAIIPTETNER